MQMEALEAAREILPLIVRHRAETESQRRIAPQVVDALRQSRLCRLAIPRELHGLELPTPDALDVYEMLAGAEASVGWIVWNNTLPSFWGRFLTPAARAEVFGNAEWLYACSTRPSGKAVIEGDGYRVSGRWSLVSGCELSEWLALRCVVEENGQPRMLQPGVPEARMIFSCGAPTSRSSIRGTPGVCAARAVTMSWSRESSSRWRTVARRSTAVPSVAPSVAYRSSAAWPRAMPRSC